MFYQIKCSSCGDKINKGDSLGVTGKWPSFIGGLFKPKKVNQTWPFLEDGKIYCQSCFNKQFKKK